MKKFMFILLAFSVVFFAIGCNDKKPAEKPQMGELAFEEINSEQLEDEELKSWYDQNHTQDALVSYDTEEFTYILLGVGEKPTGGYELNITSVTGDESNVNVRAEIVEPSAETMVTQVITYPNQLVRIKQDNRDVVLEELVVEQNEEENNTDEVAEEVDLKGIYVGQIDSNSIEITVDGEPMAFRLSSDIYDDFNNNPPEDNSEIGFTAYENEHGQWILTSYKTN